MDRFVLGNRDRIFVNPALGCNSNCSYCYLPSEGFVLNSKPRLVISEDELIGEVSNADYFVPGRHGTVISIGCFSECWDKANLGTTKGIISHYLQIGNPIQFATKRIVKPTEILSLIHKIEWKGQLSAFISCASISHWETYERGTPNPRARFKNIRELKKLGLEVFLYIKPVIEGITIQDISNFMELVAFNNCDVVVGSLMAPAETNLSNSPIPNTLLRNQYSDDEFMILEALEGICNTFRSSIDAVTYLRSSYE